MPRTDPALDPGVLAQGYPAAGRSEPHQNNPMKTEPEKQHAWLQQLVGEWTSEARCAPEPGTQPETFKGTEIVRSLGSFWILAEGNGQMPGTEAIASSVLTLGFDPRTRRFVGTWVGSPMAHLWIYNGALNDAGNVLTLETEGPDCSSEGGMTRYKDIIELRNPSERVLRSEMLCKDGTWKEVMTVTYRRKGSRS
jgi:hypothetical protein